MAPFELVPPATSTRPSGSTAQDWYERGELILAAADQLPVVLKRSAVLVGTLASAPPLISRRPSLKTNVQAPLREAAMLPSATQVPVATVGNDARSKRVMAETARITSVGRSARCFILNLEGDKNAATRGGDEAVKTDRSFKSCLSNELCLSNPRNWGPSASATCNLRHTSAEYSYGAKRRANVAVQGIRP